MAVNSILSRLSRKQKLLIATSHDAVISFLSITFAIILRLDENIFDTSTNTYFIKIIIATPFVQVPIFYLLGVYKGVWRYSSTPDLIKVIKSCVISTVLLYLCFYFILRLDFIPRSIPIIQLSLLILLMGGGRLSYRIFRDTSDYGTNVSKGRNKLLIIGAGHGGERLFREIRKNPILNLHVIGFIDDSPAFLNRTIHGVPVLGTSKDLPKVIQETHVQKVYIAIPSADSKTIRSIYEKLKPFNLEIKVLPSMNKIMAGDFQIQNLEKIKIEDLLGREEINIESDTLSYLLEGRKVMVTGAGGSIGSELCNQLANFNPSQLVALDISEYNCYELDKNLRSHFPNLNITTIVGDVRDFESINNIITREKPYIVFHAAAYKHVPLMEFNPFESCRTNVFGTENVAHSCIQNEVERFVLVSTDKAVNPTNIMGTSKRVAELVVQNLKQGNHSTKLMIVRFGNVLGSSGSVIPLFRQQIKEGGPITVTHSEITRFFMSIPEASKLVIQAGAIGQGGEIFVLDMGSPVKILDLAKEMISLAGLQEDIDIKIKITGLRPGEKLYEEPLMDQESLLGTTHPKVLVSKARPVPLTFNEMLDNLKALNFHSSRNDYIKVLNIMVPEYKPYITEEIEEEERTFQ
ncbi:MAG: polysaccharide biosynthesis protein [Halobacteriovoraceae bacterium]|nr:polysaccharide biosynthesis protein [Halobacteriovoraceae bacterium]